jgi:hypothetical protein
MLAGWRTFVAPDSIVKRLISAQHRPNCSLEHILLGFCNAAKFSYQDKGKNRQQLFGFRMGFLVTSNDVV